MVGAFATQKALITFGGACKADFAAKTNNLNVPENPVVFGEGAHKILLNFFGIALFGKTQLVGNSLYVSVDHDAGLVENIAANDIGCLSAYSCKRSKSFDVTRNFASVIVN